MSFLGDVKKQSELQQNFASLSLFRKAIVNRDVTLPDGSKWRQILKSAANKHLWQGERSNTALFECIEVPGSEEIDA